MKTRKIIIAVIFSILILGSNQYSSVHAKKRSSVSLDESSLQRNVESYLQSKYGT